MTSISKKSSCLKLTDYGHEYRTNKLFCMLILANIIISIIFCNMQKSSLMYFVDENWVLSIPQNGLQSCMAITTFSASV